MQYSKLTNIAVIPIDNRPICYDLIADVVSIDESLKLYMPDLNCLGGLYSASDTNKIFEFIKNLPEIDYLIVSLDTLAYGGLINSRRCTDSLDDIKERIIEFKNLIPKNTKVLAFSSVMRISNNNINEEEKEYWSLFGKKIFEYSYKSHKLGYEVETDVPKEILEDYLNARKRNFEINRFYLNLAKEGFFDTLIFSKDDCAQFGLNVKEAKALEYLIKKENLKNVFIKTGADEIPLTLLARALTSGKTIKIKPLYIENDSKKLISKYEDISVEKCVEGQLSLANLQISVDADMIMLINNFKDEQGDLVLGDVINNISKKTEFPKTPYFIADINNANGADDNFIKQLFLQKTDNLYGYCGYNTSANTIGCAILTSVVKFLALKNNSYNDLAFKKLQFIRLADDWSYQAKNRKKVKEAAPDFLIALNQIKPSLNTDCKLISDFLNYYPNEINYSLPWNRSFEIRVEIF